MRNQGLQCTRAVTSKAYFSRIVEISRTLRGRTEMGNGSFEFRDPVKSGFFLGQLDHQIFITRH